MPEGYPTVSVVIPHYNMHGFLPDAIKSVDEQEYPNIELIVVDDGSETPVNGEQCSVKNVDFKFLEIDHGGKAKAVNRGFEEVTGDYLTILDADDQLPKGSLSDRIEALEEDDADLSIGSFEVQYQGDTRTTRHIDRFVHFSNIEIERALFTKIISPFHQNAMLFSKGLLNKIGGMDPRMLLGQDKDFAVRLLRESRKTTFVKQSVYVYNRYDRPFATRMYNRMAGMRYKLQVIVTFTRGWRRLAYLGWIVLIEGAKLVYDLFGIYKR